VHRKTSELWPDDWILLHDKAPAHKALSLKQFLAKKSITEMEHPPCSPDMAPNDFRLFPKIKSAFKGRRFLDIENIGKKNIDNGTESSSITVFPAVALLLS
jgi:hypothetical protein